LIAKIAGIISINLKNDTMKLIFILTVNLILINILSCQSVDKQLLCFKNQQTAFKDKGISKEVIKQFNDSLNLWISKDLYGVQRLKKIDYKIDENIFINTTHDKCILGILEVDTLSKYYDIQMVFGRLLNNKTWQFMMSSMATISYVAEDSLAVREDVYLSLSNVMQKKFMEGGYYKSGKCEIDDKWVNGWLNDYLIKYHQEFLEGKRL
jgi:hypothetical protein